MTRSAQGLTPDQSRPVYVASEEIRYLIRGESYSLSPGPAIPGGAMHGFDVAQQGTLCGLDGPELHHWPVLDFPRNYGTHCEVCSDAVTGGGRVGL